MSSLYDDNIKYFDKGNLLAELIIIRNYTQINSFVVTGIGVYISRGIVSLYQWINLVGLSTCVFAHKNHNKIIKVSVYFNIASTFILLDNYVIYYKSNTCKNGKDKISTFCLNKRKTILLFLYLCNIEDKTKNLL